MDKLKGSLFSKTMWFGFCVTALGFATWVQDHTGLITMVAPEAAPFLVIIGPIVMFLRIITNQPLEAKVSE